MWLVGIVVELINFVVSCCVSLKKFFVSLLMVK